MTQQRGEAVAGLLRASPFDPAGDRLAARAAYDDVAVTLDVTPGVPHVFQAFAAILDEGEAALTRAGTFLRQHIAAPETP